MAGYVCIYAIRCGHGLRSSCFIHVGILIFNMYENEDNK